MTIVSEWGKIHFSVKNSTGISSAPSYMINERENFPINVDIIDVKYLKSSFFSLIRLYVIAAVLNSLNNSISVLAGNHIIKLYLSCNRHTISCAICDFPIPLAPVRNTNLSSLNFNKISLIF